jgi:hypothetical protein
VTWHISADRENSCSVHPKRPAVSALVDADRAGPNYELTLCAECIRDLRELLVHEHEMAGAERLRA